MKTRMIFAGFLLAAPLLLSACSSAPGGPTAGGHAVATQPRTLTVAAASSLRAPLEALAPAFERANPGVRLAFDFGASGVLQKQIESGAPVDVFASASPLQVDALVAGGLLSAEETATFATNDLVVAVPKGDPAGITSPSDLARARRLTTGNPETAPHGTKAREWLTKLGLWDRLKTRFVFAENAAQAMQYVARGEVDAGVVFGSEARTTDAVDIAYTVPTDESAPSRYVAAPLLASRQQGLARAFVAFLLSAEAQAALRDAGFRAAPERR